MVVTLKGSCADAVALVEVITSTSYVAPSHCAQLEGRTVPIVGSGLNR